MIFLIDIDDLMKFHVDLNTMELEQYIEAYVDLSEYVKNGPGTYEVPVQIKQKTTNARLSTFTVSPDKVKIKLTKN